MAKFRSLECTECIKNAEYKPSVFMENMTIKTFALLEFMEAQGYHQIPFETCKVPESQNYVEKLNFGLNIDFAPINTRLNLLVSDAEPAPADSNTATNTPETTNNTANTDNTTTTDNTANNAPSQRILENTQSRCGIICRPTGKVPD